MFPAAVAVPARPALAAVTVAIAAPPAAAERQKANKEPAPMEDFAIIVPNIALVEMTCRQTMISMAY